MKDFELRGKVKLLSIGIEKTPVLVIDDFSPHHQECIDLALSCSYSRDIDDEARYPGDRALIGSDYGNTVLRSIADLIRAVYKVPRSNDLYPHAGYYSLVTLPEDQLEFVHTVPHFDNLYSHYYAAMHYLNPGEFGGTGFYRHKPTGYERISEEVVDKYFQSAQDFIDDKGHLEKKYITESTGHYELLEKIEYKQNRFIIFPGNLLHSAYIDKKERDINPDPKTGRLTANFFFIF
ncbi:DUF6445 family protein [Paraglaciecola aquimarina]|uniref:DUF6445 family protein n=1 Tax=Paraglaciecola aquimarina TaxID=1235557 RepID=A0ABU3SYB3_9ALTE|nr:DUF6445 family protein [Paraglaciecola aquimarina]MDU0355005.1 DUF6445 family protein [Paraglaciecola aquimarina]